MTDFQAVLLCIYLLFSILLLYLGYPLVSTLSFGCSYTVFGPFGFTVRINFDKCCQHFLCPPFSTFSLLLNVSSFLFTGYGRYCLWYEMYRVPGVSVFPYQLVIMFVRVFLCLSVCPSVRQQLIYWNTKKLSICCTRNFWFRILEFNDIILFVYW